METETGTPSPRGKRLIDRLTRLGISDMSDRELQKVLGIARETWVRIETGADVRPSSYEKAEDGLAAWIEENGLEGEDVASTATVDTSDFVQFELNVDAIGLRIVGKGTTANMAEVRKQVADLYREIRDKGE